MKYVAFLGVTALIVGCGHANIELNASRTPAASPAAPSATLHIDDRDVALSTATNLEFVLSDAAADEVREIMKSQPGFTHLAVSVEFGKSCQGFQYGLKLLHEPPESEFAYLESKGIQLAVERKSASFLHGTTLDWIEPSTGKRGFLFRNPNAKESAADESEESGADDEKETAQPDDK